MADTIYKNIELDDGTAAFPSLTFSSSGGYGNGLFLKSAGVMGLSIQGTEVGTISSLGIAAKGITGATDAAAGYVGEVFRSYVAAFSVTAATNTWSNVTSITLSAGDYVLDGIVSFTQNAATVTAVQAAISVNTGNTTTDHAQSDNWTTAAATLTVTDAALVINGFRINVSTSTVVYLKGLATFSAGTPKFNGRISARRVR